MSGIEEKLRLLSQLQSFAPEYDLLGALLSETEEDELSLESLDLVSAASGARRQYDLFMQEQARKKEEQERPAKHGKL